MPNEYVIWGVPNGEQDEAILYTKATSMDSATKIKTVLEKKHACTGVRIQVIDMSADGVDGLSELFSGAI